MLNKAGRIHASSLEEAVAQIPEDIKTYSIWWTGQWIDGLVWFEYRGWVKEIHDASRQIPFDNRTSV